MSVKSQPNGNQIIETLCNVSFFSMLNNDIDSLKRIAAICKRKTYKKRTYIIKEGDYGDDLFIIINGEIEIIKKTMQDEEYTVATLDASTEGISVGELALIDNDRRSASVLAVTDCECLVIDRDDFINFGDKNPRAGLMITRAIASLLSANLRKANEDVITLFSALVHEVSSM